MALVLAETTCHSQVAKKIATFSVFSISFSVPSIIVVDYLRDAPINRYLSVIKLSIDVLAPSSWVFIRTHLCDINYALWDRGSGSMVSEFVGVSPYGSESEFS